MDKRFLKSPKDTLTWSYSPKITATMDSFCKTAPRQKKPLIQINYSLSENYWTMSWTSISRKKNNEINNLFFFLSNSTIKLRKVEVNRNTSRINHINAAQFPPWQGNRLCGRGRSSHCHVSSARFMTPVLYDTLTNKLETNGPKGVSIDCV